MMADGGKVLSGDSIVFAGKVIEALFALPSGKVPYGEFYVSRVEIKFDGDSVGFHIEAEDDFYNLVTDDYEPYVGGE